MNNQIKLCVIIIYNPAVSNLYLAQARASVSRASQVVLYDVGPEPIRDFAAVRNQALKLSQEDYTLFLDADEVMTESSWLAIEQLVKQAQVDLVWVERQDVFYGQVLSGGEARQSLIRLGRTDQIKFIRPIHETIQILRGQKTIQAAVKLLHYSHPNLNQFLEKISYYSRLEAELRHESSRWWLLLKLMIFPGGKFLVNFFIRRGYRDRMRGFIYAAMMSLHSLLVRIHGLELRRGG